MKEVDMSSPKPREVVIGLTEANEEGQRLIERLETDLHVNVVEAFNAQQDVYKVRIERVTDPNRPTIRQFELAKTVFGIDGNLKFQPPGEKFQQYHELAVESSQWGAQFEKTLSEIQSMVEREDPKKLIQQLDVLTQYLGKDGKQRNTNVNFQKAIALRQLLVELAYIASQAAAEVGERALWISDPDNADKKRWEAQEKELITLSVDLGIDARILHAQIDLTQQLIDQDLGGEALPIGVVDVATAQAVRDVARENRITGTIIGEAPGAGYSYRF